MSVINGKGVVINGIGVVTLPFVVELSGMLEFEMLMLGKVMF